MRTKPSSPRCRNCRGAQPMARPIRMPWSMSKALSKNGLIGCLEGGGACLARGDDSREDRAVRADLQCEVRHASKDPACRAGVQEARDELGLLQGVDLLYQEGVQAESGITGLDCVLIT